MGSYGEDYVGENAIYEHWTKEEKFRSLGVPFIWEGIPANMPIKKKAERIRVDGCFKATSKLFYWRSDDRFGWNLYHMARLREFFTSLIDKKWQTIDFC